MKKTLLTAALMIAFSLTLLAGSTYAWFTDSQTHKAQVGFGDFDMVLYIDDPADATAPVGGWEFTEASDFIDMLVDDARDGIQPGSVISKDIIVKNEGNIDFVFSFDQTNIDHSLGTLTATFNGNTFTEGQFIRINAGGAVTVKFQYTVSTSLGNEYIQTNFNKLFDITFAANQVAKVDSNKIVN